MRYVLIALLALGTPVSASSWSGGGFGVSSSDWRGGSAAVRTASRLAAAPTAQVVTFTPGFAANGALLTPEMVAMGASNMRPGKAGAWSPASGVVMSAPGAGTPAPLGSSASWNFSPTDENRHPGNPNRPAPKPKPGPVAQNPVPETPAPIPLPPAAFLLIGGIAAMAAIRRRKA